MKKRAARWGLFVTAILLALGLSAAIGRSHSLAMPAGEYGHLDAGFNQEGPDEKAVGPGYPGSEPAFLSHTPTEEGELYIKSQAGAAPPARAITRQEAEQRASLANSGLFKPYVTYSGGSSSVGIGDFDHDGLNDLASCGNSQLYISLQQASGTLSIPFAYASPSAAHLAVGDLNHDGRDDVAVANDYTNTIGVFVQQLNGTLASQVTYNTGDGPDAIAVGDLNNDGRDDVVVPHWRAGYIGVFLQKADGTLQNMTTYQSPEAGWDDIDVGDLNGDGRTDVVKMNGQGLNPNLSVYLQKADGTLDVPVSYDLGDINANGIAVGDVTGDGRDDAAVSYGGNRPSSKLAIFAQTISGTLQLATTYDAYDIPEPIEIADVNADGRNDVMVVHGGYNAMGVFLQRADGSLAPYELYELPYASRYNPQGLAIGDINHDGYPDVAIADYNHGVVVLYHSAPDFRLGASPAARSVEPGRSITWTVSATPAPWWPYGAITLSVAGLPSGAAYTLSPNPTTCPGQSILSVQLSSTTPLSFYHFSLAGVGSGLWHTTTVDLSVSRPCTAFIPLMTQNYLAPILDDFSNPLSGWPAGETMAAIYQYLDGEYRIYNKTGDQPGWATAGHSREDFDAAVTARRAGDIQGAYGLLFGRDASAPEYYVFLVWPDSQTWELSHYQPSTGFETLMWNTSTAIQAGGAGNRLRILRQGDGLTLWVNGTQVYNGVYATYIGQREIGLFAIPKGTAGYDARFDNYELRRP